MVCYAHLHLIKETTEITTTGKLRCDSNKMIFYSPVLVRTKASKFIVKDSASAVESLADLCLAMVTYDLGRYEKSIQLFEKVVEFMKLSISQVSLTIGSKHTE